MSPAAIEVRDLGFDYHGEPVLEGLGFEIQTGERVGLVGPNGAGKTTLLLLLDGLLRGRGEVRVLGTLLADRSLPWIRARLGLVFADPQDQLFMPTLLDDAAFGPLNMGLSREAARERARDALERMRLAGLAERSPHQLSHGEQRRAAMAAVLSMQPAIWLLDEPAANLDPQGRSELIELLRELPTLLLASHDLDLVLQVCERCLVLDGGQLVAQGPTRELLSDESLMTAHRLEVPLRLALERRQP
ncbi:MAG: energy-coupling factor ABC transporter ATP-binding protein [Deltaproteobacteria bacterium]|nr:energy-coupling factor ABC transporter ATP-binding protein [Deltaproteobacteria bacterium]